MVQHSSYSSVGPVPSQETGTVSLLWFEAFTVGKVTFWHGRSPGKFEDRQKRELFTHIKISVDKTW